jgi:hypothetical protein
MRRQSGYYWVKNPDPIAWTIAYWNESLGWWVGDFESKKLDDYWLIIDERQIVHRE